MENSPPVPAVAPVTIPVPVFPSVQSDVHFEQVPLHRSFTGQHICAIDTPFFDETLIGRIVSTTGSIQNLLPPLPTTQFETSIHPNNAIPVVALSTIPCDSKVFGVIASLEHHAPVRHVSTHQAWERSVSDRRVHVNSLGEGGIWISDQNGILDNGDLIVTSSIPINGIGAKQSDDIIRSCTVAKITIRCDFQPKSIPRMSRLANEDGSGYQKDSEGNHLLIPSLDMSGIHIMDPEYIVSFVSDDGSILTKKEYESLKAVGHTVFHIAYVSCNYLC